MRSFSGGGADGTRAESRGVVGMEGRLPDVASPTPSRARPPATPLLGCIAVVPPSSACGAAHGGRLARPFHMCLLRCRGISVFFWKVNASPLDNTGQHRGRRVVDRQLTVVATAWRPFLVDLVCDKEKQREHPVAPAKDTRAAQCHGRWSASIAAGREGHVGDTVDGYGACPIGANTDISQHRRNGPMTALCVGGVRPVRVLPRPLSKCVSANTHTWVRR